eukprot:scaffold1740_cov16-Prasinocladus_malaysianus.AAC.1
MSAKIGQTTYYALLQVTTLGKRRYTALLSADVMLSKNEFTLSNTSRGMDTIGHMIAHNSAALLFCFERDS